MKKKLSLLLASALVATMVPVSSFAVNVSKRPAKDVEVGDTSEQFTVTLKEDPDLLDEFKSGSLQYDVVRKDGNGYVQSDVTFKSITVSGVGSSTINVGEDNNTAFAPITITGAGNEDAVTFKFDLNFKDAVEGENVYVKISDIGSTETGLAGTYELANVIGASSTDILAMTVKDKDMTVSEKGGKLSQVTIKNFDKEQANRVSFELDNATLDKDNTKVYVDGVDKTADFKSNGYVTVNASTETVIIEPAVKALDSDLGSVELTAILSKDANEVSTKSVVIGEVVDYEVTVKVTEKDKKDIPTIVGGEDKDVTFTIEGTKGSITADRKYTITLDGAEFVPTTAITDGKYDASSALTNAKDGKINEDKDELTFIANDTDKITVNIAIKASATAKDGVATATVESRDLSENVTLDVAKIEKAYAFDTKVTDVKRGESVETANIAITETKVGQIGTNESIYLVVDGKIAFNELPTVEGTNGIKFDDAKWVDGQKYSAVEIPVSTRSKGEPATITISDLAMDMESTAVHNRTYQVDVYVGKADQKDMDKLATKYADLDYAKCVAEYAIRKPQVVFTLGSADYTVNGTKKTLEAPVFTKDDRTMLPVGPLGLALGLDVSYNESTQTATFIDRDTNLIVTIKENADVLYMNGVAMPMTTSAITVNGRIFVPVSSVTQAFGLPIVWDAATSTVTIN